MVVPTHPISQPKQPWDIQFCIFVILKKISLKMSKRHRSENGSEQKLQTTNMRNLYTPDQIDGFFLRGANQGGSNHVYPCCFCERWLLSHGRPRHLRSKSHKDRKYMYYLKARACLDTVMPRDVGSVVLSFLTGKCCIRFK